MGIKVVTGHKYLGGFIGDSKVEKRWLARKVAGWTKLVETLAGVPRKHSQSAYSELKNSLQQEWAFVQRFTPIIGNALGPVEKVLRDTFAPELFEGLGERTLK